MAEGRGKGRPPSVRATAVQVVAQVLVNGRSLSTALGERLGHVAPPQRGFLQELCYGTLRWQLRLAAILARLLERPLKAKEREVELLLLIGLYQLLYLEVPPHAAVSETVAAADELGKGWAKGLVNGVLRGFQRRREELLAAVDREEDARLAHPRWLLALLRSAWPDEWLAIAAANNARPPLTLRVNRRRTDRERYRALLAEEGLAAHPLPAVPTALVVETPVPVERLPYFADGMVSVQDGAAQLAAGLLQLAPGMRVLDACSAPGGKTGHILESAPDLQVTALDVDARRLARVRENLQRLGLSAHLLEGDAAAPSGWWDGQPFERILLDAPCSGSGVIRRHPDIKALRRAEDIPALAAQQQALLRSLWPLLRPGGILVYATCSVLPQENAQQVASFLQAQADAKEIAIDAQWGRPLAVGRQTLPGEDEMDGFYYACLVKG